ncbi:LysR family transcriptional regulator [Seohaeicola saemankumensis]|nr:LysR family transcriptional regulator [Seohaeicola saemankumensis]MCA0873378.1 LysR family transcriptional regulator [Seohaeicola saemankumensis]
MSLPRRLMPSLAALRALDALDRLGSASAVAEELSLTQSAVSRQLQSLETQMGVTLVDRDRKRLNLTPAGQRFVADIRPAMAQIVQAALQLQVPQTGGSLNLAILPAFGMRWLMPRLPDFARLHPDVTINMATRLEPFNFAGEPFDAAIWYGSGDWPGTESLLLKHEQVVPVCSPDVARRIDGAETLLKIPLLHIQSRPGAWSDWFARQNVSLSGPVPGTLYDQFSTITQAALHGLGVALMPDYLVEQDLATGRLAAPCGPPIETDASYHLVWPAATRQDTALSLFRDWLSPQAQPEDPLPR